ncbi:glycosyltransferase [Pseudomonas sp. LP_7_YM]|uniref:glycosyltransferase n=1 Tax=Pseudomonas sp. LP_7_YM TaxID=2485137 RepID=UPI00105D166C|nr:glycosyltransferase [Pseudomonas sp. LP_7_YM]TDV61900.1 GT2 family glycosyltransferase [Pseudomonas sp. LP_7_YM]
MHTLEQYGYTKDSATGVWVRSDFQGIAYSDGDDAETELAKIISEADDVSVLSDELPQYCTDWAKLYHLSSTRGNILRPFEHVLQGRVLEIGAGCGAISRYLGECGADLLCLEGSPRRAAIAASRTRDLPNVTVLAERFDDFKVEEKFDVVTLIGVLEYASMFSSASDPALAMLMRIRELLKPDGHLFIAIENQLGLKYFAGAPEDHIGVTMYGIEGRYEHGQPKTFGKSELERLIASAGFATSEFLAPSPDYKLPNSIITESGFKCTGFDAAALAWQNVKKDPQLPEATTFNLEKAWPVVVNNRLGMDLANSFLVVAACQTSEPLAKNILAYHYSTGRRTRYCKESLFVNTPQGIQVKYRKLGKPERHPVDEEPGNSFRYVLPRIDTYVSGKVLSLEFLDIAARRDWNIESFVPFLNEYILALKSLLADDGASQDLSTVHSVLPGKYIDAVPQNIVITADGTPQLIDVEWEMMDGVELGHLLMRALLLLMAAANPFYPSAASFSRQEFVTKLLASAGLNINSEDCDRYIAMEAVFQEKVTGAKADQFLNWAPEAHIHKVGGANAAPPKYSSLYISDDNGDFSEQSALHQKVEYGQQRVRFSLPDQLPACRILRFDPVNQRQGFSIGAITVYSRSEPVWEWQGDINDPLVAAFAVKIAQLGNDTLYLALSDDPSVTLPLTGESLQGTDSLELEVSLTIFTEEQLAHEINVLNESGLLSPHADLQSKLDLIVGSNKEIADALEFVKASVSSTGTISELNQSLLEKERKLRELHDERQRMVQEHESQIQVLTDQKQLELQAKDLQVQELIGSKALDNANSEEERLQIIEALSDQITLKDEALQATLDKWQESLSEKDVHIRNLEEQLRVQQVEKDTHIHNLNLHLIAIQSSASWKAMGPARKAKRIARRLKKASSLLPSVIRRGGGLQNTIRKAIAVWRQQGTAGLVARVRWIAGTSNFEFVGQETREVLNRHDYSTWVKYYDTMDDSARWRINEEIRKWKSKPLISIIMPVYNPPLSMLREAVNSISSQLYKDWELCIADDASSDPEVTAYLKSLQKQDRRFKVVFRKENGHISNASNSALELASGRFIALMDNDDLLPENALYWVARAIHDNPDVGLIYSDEDKIDNSGQRSSPYFKSDWNEFLFRSQNMVCHLGVYKLDLVKQVGGFRPGFEGAQDYDLALRCAEHLQRDQIVHIPRVLYHWRIHSGSTALGGSEKPYAALAGVKALDEHLQRKGNIGITELLPMGMYRVRYMQPTVAPLVSLIIPTRNAYALVKQCIDSIEQLTTYPNYEIILIDNGSDDPVSLEYFAELDQQENIRVMRDDGPFNYSALNNKAVQLARGELVGLVNNDIEVITPEWLDEMVSIALQPNVGAVGARLWYPDNRLQHGGVVVGVGGVAGHSHKYLPKGDYGYFCRASLIQEFSAVTAACLIIKKSIFEQVNGLDEENLKIAFNDVDFCLRVQEAGYINVWTPFAELYHHESATRGLEDTPEKKERFSKEVLYIQARWPKIQEDYTYNPNLTLDHEDFGLAWPPRVKI